MSYFYFIQSAHIECAFVQNTFMQKLNSCPVLKPIFPHYEEQPVGLY